MLESDRLGEVLVFAGMGSRLPFDGPLVAAACLRARGGSDGCARGRRKGHGGRRRLFRRPMIDGVRRSSSVSCP